MVSGLVQSLSAPSYEPGLLVTGVSFRTLSVEWRERLAKVAPTPESIGDSIVKRGMAREAAVLSTCNRFEIVSVGGDGGGIKAFFESLLGVSKDLGDAL